MQPMMRKRAVEHVIVCGGGDDGDRICFWISTRVELFRPCLVVFWLPSATEFSIRVKKERKEMMVIKCTWYV